jgi:hypothetical protein
MALSVKDLDLAWGEYHHAERALSIARAAYLARVPANHPHPLLQHEKALAEARVERAKARLLLVREALL